MKIKELTPQEVEQKGYLETIEEYRMMEEVADDQLEAMSPEAINKISSRIQTIGERDPEGRYEYCKKVSKRLKLTKFYLNNTKLMRMITNNPKAINNTDDGWIVIDNLIRNQPDAKTYVTLYDHLAAEKDEDVILTNWDRAILDAVFTLYTLGYKVITDRIIAMTLAGDFKSKVGKSRIDSVHKSVQKLRSIAINIDTEDEFYYRQIDDDAFLKDDYLLPIKDIAWKHPHNKSQMTGYYITNTPPTHYYGQLINQIISVPMGYIQFPEGINGTEENIAIRNYLIRRIETLKNSKNKIKNTNISLEWKDYKTGVKTGMLPELGIDSDEFKNWNCKKAKIVKVIERLLGNFRNLCYIKNYSKNTVNVNANKGGFLRNKNIGFHLSI